MKRKIRFILKLFPLFLLVVLFVGCGASSTFDEEGRVISGTLVSADKYMQASDGSGDGTCLDGVCDVEAYNSDGSKVSGEVDPANHRWRVRVRNGNWMFGFLDGSGQRLGYLSMNGILAVTIEGDEGDIDLGDTTLKGDQMIMTQDAAGLGYKGISTFKGQYGDRDCDGIPAEFDPDEDTSLYDPTIFDILLARPYDGQTYVSPCRPIRIFLNKLVDDATVSEETIVVKLADETLVTGTIEIFEDAEAGTSEIKFSPQGGYPMGAEVSLLVVSGENGVLSEAGDALAEELSVTFTIRDFGGFGMTCHDPDDECLCDGTQQQDRTHDGPAFGS